MRAIVLVGSMAAHSLVLWWIASQSTDAARPPRPAAGRSRVRVSQPAAIPIELAFVGGADAAPARGGASGRAAFRARASSGARVRGDVAAVSSAETVSTEPTGTAGTTGSSGASLLRMRGADLRLDAATAERVAAAAGPAEPRDEVRSSGRLESQPGGRAVVRDTVTTMDVDRDGSVRFRDRPTFDVKVQAPGGVLLDPEFRREVKQHVAKWLEDPYEGTRYGSSQDLPRHLQAVPGACDAWGKDLCQDPLAPEFEKRWRAIKAKLGGGISGTFDVTDLVTRKRGGDPYASRKRKLLDDTRDERVAMGERHRAREQARSAELVRRNLERLWATELDPVARRAALFELWDECDEDDTGKRARAMVIGWIRAHLPRGSAHAFTDAELEALRARRTSTETFAPYE